MGVSERKQKEKEIRRNDIIEAAERVFFTKGYSTSTMDDVAKEAEFSKRTVYVYFKSKEQLYFEIMIRGWKLLNTMLEEELNTLLDGNSLQRLRQIGTTLFTFSQLQPNYFEAIVEYETGERDFEKGITDQSREECYAEGEKIFRFLMTTLQQGVEEGSIRKDLDLLNTAVILWSSTIGVFNVAKKKANYIKHYHHRNSEELIPEAFELLLTSIKN
ncbi:TetR/AcrR family transcriptional regulator [Neobacillus sp. PS3-12]|uniref:TetR/AcrR family transcriptional regulator n=1 Tax=Neobacillus sp. PS3-12 TaxID=3070677 RepID=UPI0027DFA612|nr:TetR/AcrR family transcriptional regulator [Neobacillus sp. PS3-12]WML52264.1 TetR/AcrR family transcriptional regulator [Neobacillus sp. PS3-12]